MYVGLKKSGKRIASTPRMVLMLPTKLAPCLPIGFGGFPVALPKFCLGNTVLSALSGAFIPCVVTAAEKTSSWDFLEQAYELVCACWLLTC